MSHESLRPRHWEQISNLTGLYGPGGSGGGGGGNGSDTDSRRLSAVPGVIAGSILVGRTYDELVLVLAEKDTGAVAEVVDTAMKEYGVI
jgi:hypothetical protein